jgi:riboflavin synthase alpha subunit
MERLKEIPKTETENKLNEVKGKAKTNLNIDPLHKAIEHVNKNNLVLYWVKYLFSVLNKK